MVSQYAFQVSRPTPGGGFSRPTPRGVGVSQHALRQTPSPQLMATAVGSTHPTGMHSCSLKNLGIFDLKVFLINVCSHEAKSVLKHKTWGRGVSGGSKGGARDARPPPPGGPNSFNFMQFLGKFGKIVC